MRSHTNDPALRIGKRLYTCITPYCAQESAFIHELPSIPRRKVLLPAINHSAQESTLTKKHPSLGTGKCVYPQINQYCAQKSHLTTHYQALRRGWCIYQIFILYCAQDSAFTKELPSIAHRKVDLSMNSPVLRTERRIY